MAGFQKHLNVIEQTLRKSLRAKDLDVNAQDENGDYPIVTAAYLGSLDALKLVMSQEPDLNVQDKNGYTALHWAAEKGRIEFMETLLEEPELQLDITNNKGFTPLHQACSCNVVDAVDTLLKSGADPNIKGDDGWTCLHRATAEGWEEIVEVLLDCAATDRDVRDLDGRTPLHIAVENDLSDIAVMLVINRADPNVADNNSETPLSAASYKLKRKLKEAMKRVKPAPGDGVKYARPVTPRQQEILDNKKEKAKRLQSNGTARKTSKLMPPIPPIQRSLSSPSDTGDSDHTLQVIQPPTPQGSASPSPAVTPRSRSPLPSPTPHVDDTESDNDAAEGRDIDGGDPPAMVGEYQSPGLSDNSGSYAFSPKSDLSENTLHIRTLTEQMEDKDTEIRHLTIRHQGQIASLQKQVDMTRLELLEAEMERDKVKKEQRTGGQQLQQARSMLAEERTKHAEAKKELKEIQFMLAESKVNAAVGEEEKLLLRKEIRDLEQLAIQMKMEKAEAQAENDVYRNKLSQAEKTIMELRAQVSLGSAGDVYIPTTSLDSL
eukprot:GFYU01003324.1.p1 GENE.GFYU01003324.1~~GFYU01003324.1.p1  ORF type:complete len:547 (-),score=153.43 GFYU01003324.1:34-1674(-)